MPKDMSNQSSGPAISYPELTICGVQSLLLSMISFEAGKVKIACVERLSIDSDSKVISTSRPMVDRVESDDSRIQI